MNRVLLFAQIFLLMLEELWGPILTNAVFVS